MSERPDEMEKEEWGEGPWQEEPDWERWIDEATGYVCLMKRVPQMGHWCGYVGVHQGHPAFGLGYDDVRLEPWPHGGLTYAGRMSEDDGRWYLGFDCAHAGDYMPGLEARLAQLVGRELRGPIPGEAYRDARYVRLECGLLATELQRLERSKDNGMDL